MLPSRDSEGIRHLVTVASIAQKETFLSCDCELLTITFSLVGVIDRPILVKLNQLFTVGQIRSFR